MMIHNGDNQAMQGHYYGEIQVAIVTNMPQQAIEIIKNLPAEFDLFFGSNELISDAARMGQIDVVQAILDKGGNHVRQMGMLDLALAPLASDPTKNEIFELFLEHVDFRQANAQNLIDWFLNAMNANPMNIGLLQMIMPWDLMIRATPRAQISILLEKCIEVAQQGSSAAEAFLYELSRSSLVEKALSVPDEHTIDFDYSEITTFYLAALNGDQSTVEKILATSSSLDKVNLKTAMYAALIGGHDILAGQICRADESLLNLETLTFANRQRINQVKNLGVELFHSIERNALLRTESPEIQPTEADRVLADGMVVLAQWGLAQEVLKYTGLVDTTTTKEDITAFPGLKPKHTSK